MLKGRGRDPRMATTPTHLASTPAHHASTPAHLAMRPALTRPQSAQGQRPPLMKPEPDYEVVEFPSEQYVNAKLQPPPPPPPRPPTGHPAEAGASCGLCGGGGARVRCTECGRRALCASCDDMYHRHPKRRHHQRQALSATQLRDERPPLPPKAVAPVPPPRRHKLSGDRLSASPRPPGPDQRRATLGPMTGMGGQLATMPLNSHVSPQHMHQQIPPHLQAKLSPTLPQPAGHLGSMPYLPTSMHHAAGPVAQPQGQANTLGHLSPAWGRPRASLPGFNMPPNMPMAAESWESGESVSPTNQTWNRPLRRGASVLELGGGGAGAGAGCGGCAHCAATPAWRYASCANLDHGWPAPSPAWPQPQPCCLPPHAQHMHPHAHHVPHTPQPYRRAESRAVSRAGGSLAGSRAASPALSVRSRASRRTKHRTPSPPPLPSSDADSESESDSDHEPPAKHDEQPEHSLGPAPPLPNATWQCEHCTFVNEPGVRVCVVCCRTPTTAPKIIAETADKVAQLHVAENNKPTRVQLEQRTTKQNGEATKPQPKKERVSTGCGPSPPREDKAVMSANRLVTPARESVSRVAEQTQHDMAVGNSPPRETSTHCIGTGPSPPRENNIRPSPYREVKKTPPPEPPKRHSVSVGPSPPRENTRASIGTSTNNSVQKKSAGTSPPREVESRYLKSSRAMSTTGTSPPPQSISTQTYEVPNSWERAPSVTRSRPRRRFNRDEARRERSHSRHSLSSDTRESERSVRTSGGGGGRWEWREERSVRDSSPAADWSEGERRRAERPARLARRASHLDLRRSRHTRSTYYGSEAASPERLGGRAMSLEALAGGGARAEAERGLELARLLGEAERGGYSAGELHAALAHSPGAPLAWLRERWPSLCAGVQAAAARLAPHLPVSEHEARAALARHRGAMWPAVTDCVEHQRRRQEGGTGAARQVAGRVWGSPGGAEAEGAPAHASPRARAEDSSDEYEAPQPRIFRDDDWASPPPGPTDRYGSERDLAGWHDHPGPAAPDPADDIAQKLKALLLQAGIPSIDENLLLKGLLASSTLKSEKDQSFAAGDSPQTKPQSMDFLQSENEFIDAYNALTRLSPLPNIENSVTDAAPIAQNVSQSDRQESNIRNEHILQNVAKTPHTLNTPEINRANENIIAELNLVQNTVSNQPKDEIIAVQENISNAPDIEDTIVPEATPATSKETSNATLDHGTKIINNDFSHSQSLVIKENNNLQPLTSKEDYHLQHNNTKQNIGKVDVNQTTQNAVITNNKDSDVTNIQQQSQKQESSTSSNTPSTYKVKQIIVNKDLEKQDEDRTNNLNDIVDTTQRLIQQMKEEINSDINSLDDRHISQSERETSSNESDYSSEHESSYTESGDETDNMTSEEDETSITDEETPNNYENGNGVIQRTSSEDNEQFEEAMDHLDSQIEDFKNKNIEILDSIARSLQEEHTITIELNESNVPNDKTQDVNNNLFVEVNSFEEIYEELNQNQSNRQNVRVIMNEPATVPTPEPKRVLPKEDINILEYKPTSATKLLITENRPPILHAVIENIEIEEPINIKDSSSETNMDNDDEILSTELEIVEEPVSVSLEGLHQRDTTPNLDVKNNDNSMNLESPTAASPKSNNTAINIVENSVEEVLEDDDNSSNDLQTNDVTTTENPNSNDKDNDESILNQRDSRTNSRSPEKVSVASDSGQTKHSTSNKSNIPKLIRTVPNNKAKEKSTPKIVSSKVPVRRTSIKQHPAPAPPKTHFGNIQSGHVKQLQTRLFNNKHPKVAVNTSATIEAKPSTSSTLNKKKPAPPPPTNTIEHNQPSSISPPKEKRKQYFRETCRTEDEWTDSDSGESQVQVFKPIAEEPKPATPSPPPPITLRRVSGQLIDLATVRLPEGSPERQARMLLACGATESWSQAQVAVQLVQQGAAAPAALLAALECADLPSALNYLHQDCHLCASKLPEHEMVSMLRCTHRCCRECARLYFTVQITERSIADCVCPFCKVPELENLPEDAWLEYFAHLDIQLKTLLETEVHELFQRKLRDRTLARDPNFRWCMECSSGFFVHPKQKKLRCPECRSVSCASCRKPWNANHEGLSCEQYAAWLDDNDPERSMVAVQQHLKENGLECPRCRFKYSLSRGGCMHFTCTQCKYEFCYGCGKAFMMGARCGLSEYCAKLGLHAHHPRNCLFYLRDKEPHELQTLLQMNNIDYETEPAEGSTGRCPIQLQRETPTGLVDGICGSEAPPKHAGLCKPHYVEYLAARARALDPIPIMDVSELVAELRRRALPLPERGPWDTDPIYAGMCAEIVREKIPLD